MTPIQLVDFALGVLALLATPILAVAQSPAAPSPSPMAAPGPSSQGGAAGVVAVVVVLALLAIVGIAVKLYDLKRKREEEALSLQARISDALLLDPSLAGLPVIASASIPRWRRSAPVVEVIGTVPTQQLRDAAVELVKRQLAGLRSGARIEDRVVVDALMSKRAA